MIWLTVVLAGLSVAGCLYLVAAWAMVTRLARRRPAPARTVPGVTILKPLHGDELGLYDNLASFCTQDYAAPVQIVCGVHRADDPAVAAVHRLIEAFPERAIELVVDGRRHGLNGKIANLINMSKRIAHEIVILSDSDIRVGPDWLPSIIAELQVPGTAGVTCLYRGMPLSDGLWPRLSALNIDTHFLPNAVLGLETGLAKPCFGSAIALRRETFDRIGGFAPLAEVLADDYALGAAIRATGGAVAVPALTVGHSCPEKTFGYLWHHELRWTRTIRSINPAGHLGSAVTHPLAFALLWLAAQPGPLPAVAVGAAITCRIALCMRIERALGAERHAYWLIPLRDCLSFVVFLASFFGRGVRWKNRDFSVERDGALAPDRRPTPS